MNSLIPLFISHSSLSLHHYHPPLFLPTRLIPLQYFHFHPRNLYPHQCRFPNPHSPNQYSLQPRQGPLQVVQRSYRNLQPHRCSYSPYASKSFRLERGQIQGSTNLILFQFFGKFDAGLPDFDILLVQLLEEVVNFSVNLSSYVLVYLFIDIDDRKDRLARRRKD